MKNYRKLLYERQAEYRAAVAAVYREQEMYLIADDDLTVAEEARDILQQVAQKVQQEVHNRIAGVVSRCLETVFDEPYEFVIDFERKRGKTEAALTFKREDIQVDPLTASGGGVVDVAAFALRLACLMLSKPRVRRVLVMDEPFRFVSREYRPRVRAMLEALSEEMGVQFIMVTHIDELRCGKVIEIGG